MKEQVWTVVQSAFSASLLPTRLEILPYFKSLPPASLLPSMSAPFTLARRRRNLPFICLVSTLSKHEAEHRPGKIVKSTFHPHSNLIFFLSYLPWREVRDHEGDTSEKT